MPIAECPENWVQLSPDYPGRAVEVKFPTYVVIRIRQLLADGDAMAYILMGFCRFSGPLDTACNISSGNR